LEGLEGIRGIPKEQLMSGPTPSRGTKATPTSLAHVLLLQQYTIRLAPRNYPDIFEQTELR